MNFNLLGKCDRRPVLYTLLPLAQTLGDTILISTNPGVLRLSDTGQSEGHFQNTLIYCINPEEVTPEDIIKEYGDMLNSFESIIVDGAPYSDANVTIYCKTSDMTEEEVDALEYFENPIVIELYNNKNRLLDENTIYNLNAFEEFRNNVTISTALISKLAPELAKQLQTSEQNITNIMLSNVGSQLKGNPINNLLRRFKK